ncbi:MAG: pyruvate dehydrogenase (acetyl-transferring), homodimeric type [Methanobacteriota archaeon]|nr:MAG: pyruvate dehydrogenase (acetyl-transferring), homodimeric type [Euryarchaeota archaeon]|tara:strand:+ start:29138 stop:31792 length:2655 start_codon:yes stop_codon:yes gene_type:complete
MVEFPFKFITPDSDEEETFEWIESILSVIKLQGRSRAERLLLETIGAANKEGLQIPKTVNTPYLNTIHPEFDSVYPGNQDIEKKLHDMIRWNAMMMVTSANKRTDGIGGHISTYASVSHLWEVGFNHHFRGKDGSDSGDHVYWQGHASPGIYARAWFDGRFDEERILNFRKEIAGNGLSSYPHPRLMPNFWEYPTVSMGLGALTAIHQARFNNYLKYRDLTDTSDSKIWYFMGDGESDEPESLSELSLASRENLDNLIFVINCNLQRLDGPVRGNYKIVQELEGKFRGAGWNVIKLLWGTKWDSLFDKDISGEFSARLLSLVDGDEQRIFTESGNLIRDELFNTPSLKELVKDLSDEELEELTSNLGGHDPVKINSAYETAKKFSGKPTVILARTVKGWGLGPTFAGRNTTHQKKKADDDVLKWMRDDIGLKFSDEELNSFPFITPEMAIEEVDYLKSQRKKLDGHVPERRAEKSIQINPESEIFEEFNTGTKGKMQVSTTMVFVSLLRKLMKSKNLGSRVVPIIPDEGRTFGMDPLFAEFGIYSPIGQLYKPVDHKVLMKYKESNSGQILQEGINEAGAMATFIASSISYSNHSCLTIPFYVFYSMFGFQRVGDLIWSAADGRSKGFLIGATSGRTTLNGEGLQHQDGHSLLIAHTNPAIKAWDPAFSYELSVIVKNGIYEMYELNKDIMYYIAVYNENYPMPAKPDGVDEGIINGLYLLRKSPSGEVPVVRLIGSGPIMLQVLSAVEILEKYGVKSEIWSATSYGELRRDAMECDRWNRLNPDMERKIPWVEKNLGTDKIPTIAVSDNIAAVPDLIRKWVSGDYVTLGTDGFGRSDTRDSLRKYFEIDSENIVIAALSSLVKAGKLDYPVFEKAKKDFNWTN